MTATIPTATPAEFVRGDTVKWRLRTVVYGEHRDPADGWTLTFRAANGDATWSITGSDNGDGYHLVSASAATTAAYAAGVYHYQATISDGSDRYQVELGRIEVLEDWAQVDAVDGRSWTEQRIDDVKAVIEGRASASQISTSIGGRSLQFMGPAELHDHLERLELRLARERRRARRAAGRPAGGVIRSAL